MAKLHIIVNIDVDPRLEDPHDVALSLLCEADGADTAYAGEVPEFVGAEWED